MVDILGRNTSSVIIYLNGYTVINYRDAYMDLVRNFLAVVVYVLDSIGQKVDYCPYDELRITVKERIYSVVRKSESYIRCTRIILDV